MPPLVAVSLAFLLGIGLSGAAGAPWPIELLLFSALLPAAVLLFWRDRRGFFASLCGFAFLLGCARYQGASATAGDALTRYNDLKAVTLQGVVSAPPDVRDNGANLRVEVARVRPGTQPCADACDWTPLEGLVLAKVARFGTTQYGDQLELSGALRAPPTQGDFSYADYLARQDIYSLMDRPRVLRLASGQGNPLFTALYALRERAHAIIAQSLPEPQAGLLSGILLGLARDIPAPTVAAFNRTSTSHIIAISGYNILIFVGLLVSLGSLVMRRRQTWLFVALGIILYCVFVGGSASVVRAGIMGVLMVLGPAFGRRSMALNALAISALLMAVQAPLVIWDVSFQLSFAATLGLIGMATPLTTSWHQWLTRHVPNAALRGLVLFAGADLMVTVAATLATLPILLYDFHTLSLPSLPVNLLVLPAQPPIMATGFLVILGGLVHPALGQFFGWLAWPFLVWTTAIVEGVAALPFAAFDTGPLPLWLAALYYLALIAAAYLLPTPQRRAAFIAQPGSSIAPPPAGPMPAVETQDRLLRRSGRSASPSALPIASAPPIASASPITTGASTASPGTTAVPAPPASRRSLWLIAGLALLAALVWVAALSQPDGRLHVTFLDVGQGDATLVQTPSGRLIVIDGGPAPTTINDAVSRSLPFYQRDLPLLVLTRASDEKMAGLVSLLERYRVTQLVTAPGAFPRSATALRWRQLLAQQFPATNGQPAAADGRSTALADPALGVISPTLGLRLDLGDGVLLEVVQVDETAGTSLRLSYGTLSVYFDGDGDQSQYLASVPDAPATVLRVGRHGDAKAVTPELLDALSPSFAMISVGATARGSAPSDETLARLTEGGATVYRTDENGTIGLTSDGERLWVKADR